MNAGVHMTQRGADSAGTFGRGARLALGLCLAVITLPVYFDADITYVSASLALTLGLVGVYIAVHVLVSRYSSGINRWIMAVLAVLPVAVVWSLGQGGGPLFGQVKEEQPRPPTSRFPSWRTSSRDTPAAR